MAGLLEQYRLKRDFKHTSEPAGKRQNAARKSKFPGGLFVIHKHDARRLHYDLRLEHNGVLWSWAVTRGPSLDPADKRLAVHVEDHPLDYAGFEGTIPKGAYGAGSVIVWDQGTWTARDRSGRWHEERPSQFRTCRQETQGWLASRTAQGP